MAHDLENVYEVLISPKSKAISIIYEGGHIEVVPCDTLTVQYLRHTTDQGKTPLEWEEISITGHTEAVPIKKETA